MRIRHLRIQNYRSIKDIELSPSDIAALVGPNNAGKSNILAALNFLLGDRYPTRQGLVDTDFYNRDRHNSLLIQAWFEENEHRISTIYVHCPPDDRMQTFCRYQGSDKDYYLRGDLRDKFPVIYIDAHRHFDSVFGTSRWSLFGRIIRQLDEDFRAVTPEEQRRQVVTHLGAAQDILKTQLYHTFQQAMADALHAQLRRTTHDIRFDFRTFDPLNFYRSLQPILMEDNVDKNPSEAGSGMRNLIVMALFQAYAEAFKGMQLSQLRNLRYTFIHMHKEACTGSSNSLLSKEAKSYTPHIPLRLSMWLVPIESHL